MSKNQIGPGNHEKAWNDPPQLSFSASNTSQTSSDRLRMMKKRIPVPIISSHPSETPPQQKLLSTNPPPIDLPHSDKTLKMKDTETPVEDSLLNSEEVLNEIENSLKEICNHLNKDAVEPSPNDSKEDILKRISIFKEMWIQDKLHPEVKKQMKMLSAALKDNSYDLAWSLHQSLIVDYTTYCSSWMLGIKALIVEARNAQTPTGMGEDKKAIDSLPLLMATSMEVGK